MNKASKHLNSAIRKNLRKHHVLSGKDHKGSFKGRSQPGEIPWKESGSLHNSFKSGIFKADTTGIVVGVYNEPLPKNINYAYFLEYGLAKINLKKRPYVSTTLKQEYRTMKKIIQSAFLGK